jgi:hypothetical protein
MFQADDHTTDESPSVQSTCQSKHSPEMQQESQQSNTNRHKPQMRFKETLHHISGISTNHDQLTMCHIDDTKQTISDRKT